MGRRPDCAPSTNRLDFAPSTKRPAHQRTETLVRAEGADHGEEKLSVMLGVFVGLLRLTCIAACFSANVLSGRANVLSGGEVRRSGLPTGLPAFISAPSERRNC